MRALIIGATGMDGRLLAHNLLLKGYDLIGTYNLTPPNFQHKNLRWIKMDLCDNYAINTFSSLFPLNEIYNLGGVTFHPSSLDFPDYTIQANYHVPLAFIEYVTKKSPKTKFFQASSSEVFGNESNAEFGLKSKRVPHSPYSYAKNMVDFACEYFRIKGFNIYNAISFNHDHFYRKPHFLLRKVSTYVANLVVNGNTQKLGLGNVDVSRDWSRATTFVDGYIKQMQKEPSELIFASGITHSVREALEIAFGYYDLAWEDYVVIKDEFKRLNERTNVWGDVTETVKAIGFIPDTDKDFEKMITDMVDYDVNNLKK
jgi:GDPmannose 4,6-dehydratase